MSSSFRLRILTLGKEIYAGNVISVIAPGVDGYFGVLAHHAPLIAALKTGRLSLRDERNVESTYAVTGGFLEVSENAVVVLADAIEPAQESIR